MPKTPKIHLSIFISLALFFSNLAPLFVGTNTSAVAAETTTTTQYFVNDLGALSSFGSQPTAINNSGDVTGTSSIEVEEEGFSRAFLYRNGQLHNLGTLSGDAHSSGYGINNAGQVVGDSYNFGGDINPFIYTDAMRSLGTPGYLFNGVRAINDDGQAAGSTVTDGFSQRAFMRDETGVMHDLGSFNGTSSQAYDISNDGNVVGSSSASNGRDHAFIWNSAMGMVDLGPLDPGDEDYFTIAYAINDHGQVVGRSDNLDEDRRLRAFIWDAATGMRDLGLLGSTSLYTEAFGINNAGQTVGYSYNGSDENDVSIERAFVWDEANGMRNLNSMIPAGSGWVLERAIAINDNGQIVGTGRHNAQGAHAFLLTPQDLVGDTPAGQNVTVEAGGVTITFDNVTEAGFTTVLAISPSFAGLMPGEYEVSDNGLAFEISTSAVYTGPITITFNVPGVAHEAEFSALRVLHGENGVLVDRTVLPPDTPAPDFDPRNISARVDSLSPFVIARLIDATSPDTMAPSTTQNTDAAPNAYGWNKTDVTVSLSATDSSDGSGVKEVVVHADGAHSLPATTFSGDTATLAITTEGITNITYYSTDNAGNVEAAQTLTVRIDKTAPEINCGSPDGLWHADDVSLNCAAADEVSSLMNPGDANFFLVTTVSQGVETAQASTGSRTVTDLAGNMAVAGPINGNRVDKKAPSITITSPIASTYSRNQNVAANYTCTDGGAGAVGCTGPVQTGSPIDTSSAGLKVFAVNATDAVGNTSSLSINYTVSAVSYQIKSLYNPPRPHRSGLPYPFAIQLLDAHGVNVSSPGIQVAVLGVGPASSTTYGLAKGFGALNPGNNFRFVSAPHDRCGYLYALDTRGFVAGTYNLYFKAGDDPVTHTVQFQIR